MRRRLAMLLSAGLVAATAVIIGTPQPAAATNVCVGDGAATVAAPGLLEPFMPLVNFLPGGFNVNVLLLQDSLETLDFFFNLGTGACTVGGLTASGFINGYCGHSGGAATDTEGHLFGWVSVGGLMLVTGGMTGIGTMNANPLVANNSCYTGHPNREGALSFLMDFYVVRANCTSNILIPFLTLTTIPIGPASLPIFTQTFLSVTVNIHSDGVLAFHAHGNIHVCVLPTKL